MKLTKSTEEKTSNQILDEALETINQKSQPFLVNQKDYQKFMLQKWLPADKAILITEHEKEIALWKSAQELLLDESKMGKLLTIKNEEFRQYKLAQQKSLKNLLDRIDKTHDLVECECNNCKIKRIIKEEFGDVEE